MSDKFYSSMYGGSAAKPVQQKPVTPSEDKPAHQRLSGLKLTNSHMHEVEINGKFVTIPSAAYIKLLEDQIKEFRKLVRQQSDELNRSKRMISRIQTDILKIKQELATTVKRSYSSGT
jgi:hypothetical protein